MPEEGGLFIRYYIYANAFSINPTISVKSYFFLWFCIYDDTSEDKYIKTA